MSKQETILVVKTCIRSLRLTSRTDEQRNLSLWVSEQISKTYKQVLHVRSPKTRVTSWQCRGRENRGRRAHLLDVMTNRRRQIPTTTTCLSSNRADETGRIGSSGNRKRGSDRQSTSNHLLTVAMATRPRCSEYLYFSERGAQNIIMLFAD